jgi:hypothetical protein
MSSVNDFLTSISKYTDFARSSRFLVKFSSPPPGNGDLSLLQYRCTDAELPGRSLATFDHRTYGLFQKYPTQTTFNELNLTFLSSGNKKGQSETGFPEKRIFEDWLDYINPTENNATNNASNVLYNFRYKKQYVRDIEITHFDVVDDKKSYKVKFIECFPISINQVSLSWQNEDVARFMVVFSYTRWQRESNPLNLSSTNRDSGQILPPVTETVSNSDESSLLDRISSSNFTNPNIEN